VPLLLIPIGTGIILANLPLGELIKPATETESGGFFWYFYKYALSNELIPLLVFLGLGALTDFEPMLSNPKTILLGAAAQLGVFVALLGTLALGLTPWFDFGLKEAASVGIIVGADGPTTIYVVTGMMERGGRDILGAVAVSQTLEMEELLNVALWKVIEVMEADAGCIYLLDMAEKELVLRAYAGMSEESVGNVSSIKLGEKAVQRMLNWDGVDITLGEIFSESALARTSEVREKEQIVSFTAAPFSVRGQLFGIIAVGSHSYREFSPREVDLLRAVGNQVGVGTQNAVLFEEVRALIRETMEAQEKERERVCLEVHDGVAQTLVSAFQFLQTMEATMPDDKQNKQLLAKATAQVRQAIQESREVINTLQPATLKDLGLVATLRQEMRNLGKETGLRIEFKADDIRLPKDIETGLYRIIHEAVVNARKHAGCNHLRIRIHDVDGRLKVEVKDWGKGFDPATLDKARRRGTGLFSIHKRAEILKGTCDIQSKAGQGTTVNVEIPMSTVALK
jgi:signal transduction histidine kinase